MRLVRAAAELIAGHTAVIERLETAPLPSAPTRHTTKKQPPHPHPDHLPTTSGGGPISRSLHRALSYPARQTVAPSAVALPIAVAQTLVSGRIGIDFQPIRALSDLRIAGYEGLARFPDIHGTSVQSIFDAARAGGLGPELELQALRRAVEASQNRPPEGVFIALNLSYRTLVCDMLQAMYERDCVGLPREGYIIEISEAEAIENFSMLREALVPIRAAGMKLAIDDVGAGQSGLRHILLLEPDMIKIDKSVTAELVERKASRAMIAALTSFGEQTDCDIVAEGVETPAQLRILQDLGTPMGQGYLLGRPCALPNTDILYEQRRGKLGGL
jgi:EAL domain-containing protein (putative c-di-GMP-specific phosphodiesterase class I)